MSQRKTVAELIEELKALPQDLPVMTRGYESGYHDCGKPEIFKVILDVHKEWYYGPHECEEGVLAGEDMPTIEAVYLGGQGG